MFILLPPSEGKLPSEKTPGRKRVPKQVARDAEPVIAHLRALSPPEQQRFYGISDASKAAAVHERNLSALDAPAIKALQRYTGVVYANLAYEALDYPLYAEERVLVVSGLFGVITGGTPIPDYKLPMNPWLAKYWKPINQERLERFAIQGPVLSLLPQAYAKAIPYEPLLHIDFKTAGGRKSAGHFGKAIKGQFVRWLLENKVVDPMQFTRFNEEGYVFDGSNFVKE